MDLSEKGKTEIEDEALEEVRRDRHIQKVEVTNNLSGKLVKLDELQEKQCRKIKKGTAETYKRRSKTKISKKYKIHRL